MSSKELKNLNNALVEGESSLMSEEITIFLLDFSGSMFTNFDNASTREQALKQAMRRYAEQRMDETLKGSRDRFAAIAFGYIRNRETLLLKDFREESSKGFLDIIENLSCRGGTPMEEAYETARPIVESIQTGFVRIVLVSDGEPWDEEPVFDIARKFYEELGVVTDTVAVGDAVGRRFMKALAFETGGTYTEVHSVAGLIDTMLKIESDRRMLLGNGILLLGSDKQ